MCDGFITISRKLQEWEWHDDPLMVALWVNLLLAASHKDIKWHGQDIGRGQFLTTLKDLAEMTGLTVRQIRTRIEKLEQDGTISLKSTNKNTLITICKYDEYQSKKDDLNQQATNERQTNDKQTTNADHNNNNKYYTLSTHTREELSRPKEVVVTEESVPELTDAMLERVQMMTHQIKGMMLTASRVEQYYEQFKSKEVDSFLMTTEQDWWSHFKNWILKQLNDGTDRTANRQEQLKQAKEARMESYAAAARGMPEYFSEVSNADGIM